MSKSSQYAYEVQVAQAEAAYNLGSIARKLGAPEDANPFNPDTEEDEAEAWAQGWNDDTCPQCHGPVHESGFCPSCKEAV